MRNKLIALMFLLLLIPIVLGADIEYEKVADSDNLDVYVYNFADENLQDTSPSTVYLTEDFQAGTSKEFIDMCINSNHAEEFIVSNTGEVESNYAVFLEGDAAKYAVPVPDTFSLKPGESITITTYYNIPKKGEYNIVNRIVTGNGYSKQFKQSINSNLCNNNYLLALNFNQTSCGFS